MSLRRKAVGNVVKVIWVGALVVRLLRGVNLGARSPHRGLVASAAAALLLIAGILLTIEALVQGLPVPLLAVLSGIALGRLSRSDSLTSAANFVGRWFLRAGIVLLGLRFSLSQLQELGLGALLLIVPAVLIGFAVAFFLGRSCGLTPRVSLLLATGTAVCGNSAIMAAAPVLDAEEHEVAVSVASVTIYGTLALFLFPLVGALSGMDQEAFGRWAGTAINDTSQVIGASFAFGEVAGTSATVVKLTRNLFILPVILGLSFVRARWRNTTEDSTRAKRVRHAVPGFVLAFVGLTVVNSVFAIPEGMRQSGSHLSALLILTALIGIGVRTSHVSIRERGAVPLMIGIIAGLILALVTFGLVRLGIA